MSRDEQRPEGPGVDPEAEREVDLSRYWRLLLARWWVVAAGIVLGGVVGYAVSLGSAGYKASATLYLGQPYSAGGAPIQTLQTDPSMIDAYTQSTEVQRRVAATCKVEASSFGNDITAEQVKSTIIRHRESSIIRITVKAKHAKTAACAADGLARVVVARIATFADQKISNFQARIRNDEQSIGTIKAGLASPQVPTTDKLIFQLQLRNFQADQITATQLLAQVKQVEAPELLTTATPERAKSISRHNAIIVAAVIGLVLGVLLALVWDWVVPWSSQRS